jgi:hypothetical protein
MEEAGQLCMDKITAHPALGPAISANIFNASLTYELCASDVIVSFKINSF